MADGRLGGSVAAGQGEASRGAELSGRAHTEIGLWLAATPPEGRNEQRLLAEVARTHGLASKRGDRGWDVEATKRAFQRMMEQDWWRQLDSETLGAPDLAKGFPLLQAALARQGEGKGPRPAPGHSPSQVWSAQETRARAESDRLPTSAETDEKAAGFRPTSQLSAPGPGPRQQGGGGPLSAEEWQQTQMPIDSKRHWLMTPTQRDNYLRARLGYCQERPSHPEWAPFDPPTPPGREAAKDLPRGQNWFSWELRGRPDLSPLPPRVRLDDLDEDEQIPLAFPREDFVVGRGLVNGHHPVSVNPKWREDNIVEIPNRWGIQDVRDKLDKNGRKIGVEYFTPQSFQCNRLVAPHLIAALDELDARGLLYLVKTMEGYSPRCIGETTTPSHHSYGIAFDINQVEYPRRITGPEYQELKRRKRLPNQDERLIAIMQKHGFFYGGDYDAVSDVMHFEYADRNVLLPKQ